MSSPLILNAGGCSVLCVVDTAPSKRNLAFAVEINMWRWLLLAAPLSLLESLTRYSIVATFVVHLLILIKVIPCRPG